MSGDPQNPCNGWAFRDAYQPQYRNGKQLAIGEQCRSPNTADGGPPPRPNLDPKLDLPKRPCTSCGRRFRPTVRRRLLCASCFGRRVRLADGADVRVCLSHTKRNHVDILCK